jgi:hypothetical protein
MTETARTVIAVVGIDIDKNWSHVVGLDPRGAVALRQKWPRRQVGARCAKVPPCLIGMEACVGAHHLGRKLKALGHDARLMPAKYVRPNSKGQKNDFRDAEAIAEAVQRPTMKFVATKPAEQLDLQPWPTFFQQRTIVTVCSLPSPVGTFTCCSGQPGGTDGMTYGSEGGSGGLGHRCTKSQGISSEHV